MHTRYPLILVDEFQDTNEDQDDMLAGNLVQSKAVCARLHDYGGDPKQAIYGFRGGECRPITMPVTVRAEKARSHLLA